MFRALKPSRLVAAVAAGTVGASVAAATTVAFAEDLLHAPEYPFQHKGLLSTFDAAAIRRGHLVYREVCASCHSLNRLAWRNLVGVAYSEEEVKAMAAESEVRDGPNDEGEMFERPGKLSDQLPAPYPNEEAARAANEGAYPPDLSLMVKARHQREDYLFALLTGYRDPPPGVAVPEGKHWNPYFAGGAIGMAQQIYDGSVEYDDGTPNTASQIAKDVSVFLAWAAEPEHDDRKLIGMKWIFALSLMSCGALFMKNWRWAPVKYRKLQFRGPQA